MGGLIWQLLVGLIVGILAPIPIAGQRGISTWTDGMDSYRTARCCRCVSRKLYCPDPLGR